MNLPQLQQKCVEYIAEEGRSSFYDKAVEIVDHYPVQAALILLSTWNSARFRFFMNNPQNLIGLENAIEQAKIKMEPLRGMRFQQADFDAISPEVRELYNLFSTIEGIEYTGASKVMHLLNRDLFVMWDASIRGEKPKKYYNQLGIEYRYYKSTAEGYIIFLKDMQDKVRNITWNSTDKTLAKAIDEANYVTITLPLQKLVSPK